MISRKTKYGIKALIYLSKIEKNKVTSIREIAKTENISKKFLEIILLDLKKNGILSSKMGKGGGYFLLKKPKEITIASIYRILEGPIALLPCASINFYQNCEDCQCEESCKINKLMLEVRNSTLKILENKTFEDLK